MGFKSLTVRAKLLWLSLGLVVPLVLAGFFNLWSFWIASRTQLEDSLVQQARLAAGGFEQQLLIHQKTLDAVSHFASNGETKIGLADYLNIVVTTRPDWLDLEIVDREGRVVAQQTRRLSVLPADVALQILGESERDNRFVVSTIDTSDKKLHVLAAAQPVGNGNFVVALIDVASANSVFEDLKLPDENIIAVFDSKTRLVYRNQIPAEQTTGETVETQLFSALAEHRDGIIEVKSPFDQIERVYGLAPVITGNYVVAVGVPSSHLYEPARQQFARQAFFGLLISSLAIIAAFAFARKIVRPLLDLTTAAHEFGAGDMSVRADIAAGGTVRELGLTFNQMADKIAEREVQLKALDKLKSEFVSSVSHELRTPLTTIKALTRVLQSDKISSTERVDYLQTIADECDRQIEFVQNLLDLSRIESGKYDVSVGPVNLINILVESDEIYSRAAASRNLAFRLNLPTDLPMVSTDAGVIRQIVTSLVGNSLKYTVEGGTIEITASQSGDLVNVEISDTGCGINESDIPHIFDKFYRGRPISRKTSNLNSDTEDEIVSSGNAGVGLGLFLVDNLVKQIGGKITVQSPVAGELAGTSVKVSLPIVDT